MTPSPEKTPAIYIPAQWRSPQDTVQWRDASGSIGCGSLTEIPRLIDPALILGFPAVSWVKAKFPAALRQHPQGLAAAIEDHLLQKPEQVFVISELLSNDADTAPDLCAIVDRTWLRNVIESLAERDYHPCCAIPEAWRGTPGEVVLAGTSGWAYGSDQLPVPLDAWQNDQPPVILDCLAKRDGIVSFKIHCAADACAPDLDSWQKALGCELTLGAPWHWCAAAPLKAHDKYIDLLQFEFRCRSPLMRLWRRWRALLPPMSMAAASLLLLHLLVSVADWARLDYSNRQLRGQINDVYQTTFPGNTALLAPVLQAQRVLDQRYRTEGLWAGSDFVPLATRALQILQVLPPGSLKSLIYEDRGLAIEIEHTPELESSLNEAARLSGSRIRRRDDGRLNITTEDLE